MANDVVSLKRKILDACGGVIDSQVERMNAWQAGMSRFEDATLQQVKVVLDGVTRFVGDSLEYSVKINAECRSIGIMSAQKLANWVLRRG